MAYFLWNTVYIFFAENELSHGAQMQHYKQSHCNIKHSGAGLMIYSSGVLGPKYPLDTLVLGRKCPTIFLTGPKCLHTSDPGPKYLLSKMS